MYQQIVTDSEIACYQVICLHGVSFLTLLKATVAQFRKVLRGEKFAFMTGWTKHSLLFASLFSYSVRLSGVLSRNDRARFVRYSSERSTRSHF